jgi:hypothetical protein
MTVTANLITDQDGENHFGVDADKSQFSVIPESQACASQVGSHDAVNIDSVR